MTDAPPGTVSVTLEEDGGIGLSLSATDRPVELLRGAAAALERYAASIERDLEPVHCAVCGDEPQGVHAGPAGEWRFEPCGHGAGPA